VEGVISLRPLDAPRLARSLQLVVTLGPASQGRAHELAEAGATAFRLNTSHLSHEAVERELAALRRELGEDVPVVLDIQGAKMRLGDFEPRQVNAGEEIELCLPPRATGLPVPHAELFGRVAVGDLISLDDDRLRLRLESVSADSLRGRVESSGLLRPRKGVNCLTHPVELAALSARDAGFVGQLTGLPLGACAFSFMRDGREAAWVRACAPGTKVVGKVERREAVDKLPELAGCCDALWICRGDLGAQLGWRGLAEAMAALDPAALGLPVLVAGQVLEHLTCHEEPTRSEVCHLYDLLSRGYAGIVLSDETAIGRDPLHATRMAAALLDKLATP
jgi:pyruvate kinase